MNIVEAAKAMADVKDQLTDAKKVCGILQEEFDELRKVVLPELMSESGLERVTVTGVGTVSIRFDAYASIKTGHTMEAYQWLADNGHEDLVKEYVQPSTLKAFLKEQFNNGEKLPLELFNFNPYEYATITKR